MTDAADEESQEEDLNHLPLNEIPVLEDVEYLMHALSLDQNEQCEEYSLSHSPL
jgi:hypothetical protein